MGSTTVIDSSRDATFNSLAIDATGYGFDSSGNMSGLDGVFSGTSIDLTNSGSVQIKANSTTGTASFRLEQNGIGIHLLRADSGTSYLHGDGSGKVAIATQTQLGGAKLTVGGLISASQGYLVGSTTVIDSARNLMNIENSDFYGDMTIHSGNKVGIGSIASTQDNPLFILHDTGFSQIGLQSTATNGSSGFTTISDDGTVYGYLSFNNSAHASAPYAGVMGVTGDNDLLFQTNSATRFTIAGDGSAIFTSELTATSYSVGSTGHGFDSTGNVSGNTGTFLQELKINRVSNAVRGLQLNQTLTGEVSSPRLVLSSDENGVNTGVGLWSPSANTLEFRTNMEYGSSSGTLRASISDTVFISSVNFRGLGDVRFDGNLTQNGTIVIDSNRDAIFNGATIDSTAPFLILKHDNSSSGRQSLKWQDHTGADRLRTVLQTSGDLAFETATGTVGNENYLTALYFDVMENNVGVGGAPGASYRFYVNGNSRLVGSLLTEGNILINNDTNGLSALTIDNDNIGANVQATLELTGQGNNFFLRN